MTRYLIRSILLLILLSGVASARAEKVEMTLDQVIDAARLNSVDAAVALNNLRAAYWQYRSYRADLLPEVNFNATLPSYFKRYSSYQQPDGSYTFVRSSNLGLSGTLSMSQKLWFSGGTVSLQTSFDMMRQLGSGAYNRYMSVPAIITLNQPLFAANSVKWNRRIEPLRYSEAKAQFLSQTETVAMSAISNFFDLVLAIENLDIARQNLANDEKLYEVAIAKHNMGKISENDVRQMHLNVLNSRSALTNAETNKTNCQFRLLSFLGIEDEEMEIVPVVPERLPHVDLKFNRVLEKALENNRFAYNQRRRQIEADYNVAVAKGNLRSINVYAQVGLTGTGDVPSAAYSPLKDNQVVEVGVSIPLIDWGKRKGRVKVAESNRQVVENTLRQEATDFRQNLFVLVERFNNQQQQVEIAALADTIADQRYKTNVETFMIGRISTLDLNDSQTSRDSQHTAYYNALFYYWYYYYQIRSLALWDFITDSSIEADFDRLIKGGK